MQSLIAAALSCTSARKRAKLMSSTIAREWEDHEARKRCCCGEEEKASKSLGQVGKWRELSTVAIRVMKKTRDPQPSFEEIFCYDNRRSESAMVFVDEPCACNCTCWEALNTKT